MKKYKLGIIEDNQQIRNALSEFVSMQEDWDLVLTAGSYEEFTSRWSGRGLDLVLCDIGLPGKSGIDAVWYIKSHSETTQVLMLSVFEEKEKVFSALCAGASGYMLKSAPLPDLQQAVYDVLSGGAAMSPRIAKLVAEFFHPKPAVTVGREDLTLREQEIVSLVRLGHSNKTVADRLFISQDTVKYHIKNIYQKLHVSSRSELILRYRDQ